MENVASEHAARDGRDGRPRATTQQADRHLNLVYNKARQAAITQEISKSSGRRRFDPEEDCKPFPRPNKAARNRRPKPPAKAIESLPIERVRRQRGKIVQIIGAVVDVEFPASCRRS